MIPGPDTVIECPHCRSLALSGSLVSGNTFGARFWTDGKMEAPMLPQFPKVTRCQACRGFFWVSDARKVGMFSFEGPLIVRYGPQGEERLSRILPEWGAAVPVRALEADEYLELIGSRESWRHEDQIYLRSQAWQVYNDRFRTPPQPEVSLPWMDEPGANAPELPPAPDLTLEPDYALPHIVNMLFLLYLLAEDESEHRLMKSELARQLGSFAEASRLAVPLFEMEHLGAYARLIDHLAQGHHRMVAELVEK